MLCPLRRITLISSPRWLWAPQPWVLCQVNSTKHVFFFLVGLVLNTIRRQLPTSITFMLFFNLWNYLDFKNSKLYFIIAVESKFLSVLKGTQNKFQIQSNVKDNQHYNGKTKQLQYSYNTFPLKSVCYLKSDIYCHIYGRTLGSDLAYVIYHW